MTRFRFNLSNIFFFAIAVVAVHVIGAVWSAPASAAPTCFGREATIVGTNDFRERLIGTPGRDVIVGLNGEDFIAGRGGKDFICGNGGFDELKGNRGADRIDGGMSPGHEPYPDILNGGDGNDRLVDLDQNENGLRFMFGGPGHDVLRAGHGLPGGEQPDRLHGGRGNDLILHKRGRAQIAPGRGDDEIRAGGGRDLIMFSQSPSGVTVDLVTGVASGEGSDTFRGIWMVRGSDHADHIVGLERSESIFAGPGDDVVDAGGGNDYIGFLICCAQNPFVRDSGDDEILGGEGADVIRGSPDNDDMDGGAGIDQLSFTLSSSAVIVDLVAGTATGEGSDRVTNIENVTGSRHDDVITGNDEPNVLDQWFGSDNIHCAGGDDIFVLASGGAGPDSLDGGVGSDTAEYPERGTPPEEVNLQTDSDTFGNTLADIENVTFVRFGLNNWTTDETRIIGDEADNHLAGNKGPNRIEGGPGDDVLEGLGGDDFLDGGDGTDHLDGGDGTDSCVNGETAVNCE